MRLETKERILEALKREGFIALNPGSADNMMSAIEKEFDLEALRDTFAGQALTAYLGLLVVSKSSGDMTPNEIAVVAYAMADAMIERREKSGGSLKCRDKTSGNWISVKDRLPDNDSLVAGFSSCGVVDNVSYRNGQFHLMYDGNWEPYRNITHWIPLP